MPSIDREIPCFHSDFAAILKNWQPSWIFISNMNLKQGVPSVGYLEQILCLYYYRNGLYRSILFYDPLYEKPAIPDFEMILRPLSTSKLLIECPDCTFPSPKTLLKVLEMQFVTLEVI